MGEDDHALVEAVRRRDPAGMEGMYRRYADRLYTYARVLLRDPDGAADAVHDTFLAADAHVAQLRDPGQLRSWLYSIVRNECRRQLKVRGRGVPLEAVDEPAADLPDPERAVDAGQVRALVHAAAAGLNPSDREVLDLAIRHDLSAPEVGAAMGLAPNHAHARISRARTQLERSLSALIVARGGTADCADLAQLVDGWDGALTPLLRKRISRHIDACAVCTRRRRDQVNPAALLAAFVPAFLAIGADVWPKLVRTSSTRTPKKSRRKTATAAAAILLLAGLGVATLNYSDEEDRPTPTAIPTKAEASPSATASAIPSAVPPALPSAPPGRPPAAPRSGPPVTDPPESPSAGPGALAVPFTLTATATTRCDGRTYTLTITATADETLATAELRSNALPGGTTGMITSGSSARAIATSLTARSLSWSVLATAEDGRTAQHTGTPVANPCEPEPGVTDRSRQATRPA